MITAFIDDSDFRYYLVNLIGYDGGEIPQHSKIRIITIEELYKYKLNNTEIVELPYRSLFHDE